MHSSFSRRVDQEIAAKLRTVDYQTTYSTEQDLDCVLKKLQKPSGKLLELEQDYRRIKTVQLTSSSLLLKISPKAQAASLVSIPSRGLHNGKTQFGFRNNLCVPVQDQSSYSFVVHFCPFRQQFFLSSLSESGILVKLNLSCALRDNQLFSIGSSYLLVKLEPIDSSMRVNTLTLEIYGSVNVVKKLYAVENTCKTVLIGRGNNCDIKIEDKMISKVQASLFYNGIEWILVDGNLDLKRISTNGTWIYASEDFAMESGLVFKSNETLFTVENISIV